MQQQACLFATKKEYGFHKVKREAHSVTTVVNFILFSILTAFI